MPQESSLHVNIPVTIRIRMNGAKGHLDAKFVSPSGIEDDCYVSAVDEDTHALRFVPKENGVHTIHIRFNGIHIPNSPFRLGVGKDDADPSCVSASGPGLADVYAGVKTEFTIDTSNAGHGNLSVTVDGPSKVTMDCSEVNEGYKVRYTPILTGDYYITVKYNAYHIAGSPFRVKCLSSSALDQHHDPEPRRVTTLTQTQSMRQVTQQQQQQQSRQQTQSRQMNQQQQQQQLSQRSNQSQQETRQSSSSQQSHQTQQSQQSQQTRQQVQQQQQQQSGQKVVQAPAAGDASKVTASGVGLSKGFVGKSNSFTVNCSNAGQITGSKIPFGYLTHHFLHS